MTTPPLLALFAAHAPVEIPLDFMPAPTHDDFPKPPATLSNYEIQRIYDGATDLKLDDAKAYAQQIIEWRKMNLTRTLDHDVARLVQWRFHFAQMMLDELNRRGNPPMPAPTHHTCTQCGEPTTNANFWCDDCHEMNT
jgi:hypothetical protein